MIYIFRTQVTEINAMLVVLKISGRDFWKNVLEERMYV
nr:MAG TPA: hypothetical protein [Caudoviricetes sp.]